MYFRVPNGPSTVQALVVRAVPVIQRTKIQVLDALQKAANSLLVENAHCNDAELVLLASVNEIFKLLISLEAMSFSEEFLVRPETRRPQTTIPQQNQKGKHQS
jgi:hypothetical protein